MRHRESVRIEPPSCVAKEILNLSREIKEINIIVEKLLHCNNYDAMLCNNYDGWCDCVEEFKLSMNSHKERGTDMMYEELDAMEE